jgi:YihY family inner membrane protein
MASSDSTQQVVPVATEVPIEQVRPVVHREGLGPQLSALAKYMVQTEVHTYAFSVAANIILSLFPFIVMLLTLSRLLIPAHSLETVASQMIYTILPANQNFIISHMESLAHPHKSTQLYSVVMLLISSTGVFLPLEVALNQVWGVTKNRSYLLNQAVSLGLVFAVGVLAMISVALSAVQQSLLTLIFFGHVDNIVFRFLTGAMLEILATAVGILIFFLVYWILPNRKVPARAVLPTAIVIGVLWEVAKYLYVLALPHLDFQSVYGPFYVSITLMMWAFLSGLLLLAGAHFSATRYALSAARQDERTQGLESATQQ